jgi:hypothetical protein
VNRKRLGFIGTAACLSGASVLLQTGSALADTSSGGADSSGPTAVGPSGAYYVPGCATNFYYDDYFGQVGTATPGGQTYEPPGSAYNNLTAIEQSHSNYASGHGVGPGAYFFLGGPGWAPAGVSPSTWGYDEAVAATNDFNAADAAVGGDYSFEFILADVEGNPGNYGWESGSSGVSANQQVWQGFYSALQGAGTNVGVYSAPDAWKSIMGGITVSQVEWTYENNADPGPPTPCPSATFSGGPGGINANFFDPANVSNDLIWQWSIGSGQGDFDQIDLTRWNNLFGTSYKP